MNPTFSQVQPYVWTANFNWQYNQKETLEELRNQPWQENGSNVFSNRVHTKPTTPILKEIVQYLSSTSFHSKLIDLVFNSSNNDLWSVSKETLQRNTAVHCFVQRDYPGFTTFKPHVDVRKLVLHGMVFFNNIEDPDQSTYFYSNEQGDDPRQMPSSFSKGWCTVNSQYSWHHGENKSTYDRYSIAYSLMLRLF